MNTGITLIDVREQAMDTIQQIKNKTLDVKDAQTIKGLLDVIVDTAKVQVEFIRALPNSVKDKLSTDDVKSIAGTLKDRDAELDVSLKQIEENTNSYKFD